MEAMENKSPRIRSLRKYGAPQWMAVKSAGYADHYQAVAKTSGLRKISKEMPTRRGLVRCVGYYLN